MELLPKLNTYQAIQSRVHKKYEEDNDAVYPNSMLAASYYTGT